MAASRDATSVPSQVLVMAMCSSEPELATSVPHGLSEQHSTAPWRWKKERKKEERKAVNYRVLYFLSYRGGALAVEREGS
jgi:hypothetical protein